MHKKLNTNPREDGFKMPAEFSQHENCWMIWPQRTDNWRDGAKPAQKVFANVANTISKYEPVTMLVSEEQYETARKELNQNVNVVKCANDDSWMRDVGPTFVVNNKGDMHGVDWIFNSWGGLLGGLYSPWDRDDEIAAKTCELVGANSYRTDFVLEGGSIHVDGEGTCYTTEECLLNENRNPHLSKKQIEDNLKKYLGVEKIIWLPLGVYNDETNGHVDNMLQVVEPGHVVLTWTDDRNDPQYKISHRALEVLTKETDAKGRKIKVTKIHQPGPLYITKQEAETVDLSDGMERESGTRLAGSYCNFYLANNAVILPIFNDQWDQNAIEILQGVFPGRKIEPILAREILLGGGNIHCITQQQPQK